MDRWEVRLIDAHDKCRWRDEDKDRLKTIDLLVPFLYDLAHFSPHPSAQAVQSVLMEKYEEFCKKPRAVLPIETVSKIELYFIITFFNNLCIFTGPFLQINKSFIPHI